MAYALKASITVDNTKVSGSSNLTNFPMLFKGTYAGSGQDPDLRTVANGGDIENTASGGADGVVTVPADLAFFADEAGTTPLDFEIESYDPSTGAIVAWIEIPSLLYNSDTEIWLHYSDSGVTTSQEDVAGTWNSAYSAVYHMRDKTTSAISDSTGNNLDGTKQAANQPIEATGYHGQGQDFDGGDDYISLPDSAAFDMGTGNFTLQVWCNFDTICADGNGNDVIFWYGTGGSNQWYIRLRDNGTTEDDAVEFATSTSPVNETILQTTNNFIETATDMFLVFRRTSTELSIWRDDGTAEETTTGTARDVTYSGTPTIRISGWPGANRAVDGMMDEMRIIKGTSLSDDWLKTEYNNHTSPSTFYTVATGTAYTTTLTEAVTLTDSVAKLTSTSISEAVALVDTLSLLAAVVIVNAVTLVDSFDPVGTFKKALTETVTLVDTKIRDLTRSIGEVVSLTDTLNTALVLVQSFSEALSLVDTLIKQQTTKALKEAIALVDSIARQIDLVRTLTEAVTLADSITKLPGKLITNTITLVDTNTKVSTLLKSISETLQLTDTFSKAADLFKSLTETLTLVDTVLRQISEGITARTIYTVKSIGKMVSAAKTIGRTSWQAAPKSDPSRNRE